MHGWLALWLCAAPVWGEYPRPTHAIVQPEPPPGSIERRDALDAMQAAIGEWNRERKEAARERERTRELRQELADLKAEAQAASAPLPEVERGPATHGGRHIEPKVIEVAPEPTHEQAEGWLESELAKHQAQQSATPAASARKQEDAQTDLTSQKLQRTLDAARRDDTRGKGAATIQGSPDRRSEASEPLAPPALPATTEPFAATHEAGPNQAIEPAAPPVSTDKTGETGSNQSPE